MESILLTPTDSVGALAAARAASAPLPALLEEAGAIWFDSQIEDEVFLGAVVRRASDGRMILSIPQGRPAGEREAAARRLVAYALSLPLSPGGTVTAVAG